MIRISKIISLLFLIGYATIGQSQTIPAVNFGMHDNNYLYGTPYPVSPIGTFRLWDLAGMSRWSDLETSRGVYNWTNLDNFVKMLNSHGVTDITYTFGYTPNWAASGPTQPPSNTQDFIDFVTAFATRYKGKITHYETWNEPYSSTFWTGSLAQLVTLHNAVFNTVKTIDPSATVHTPVLVASSTPNDCNNQYAGTYSVGNFLAANGASNFDVVDLHLYPYPVGTAEELNTGTQIANARCSMSTHGIGSKPIWNTEFGWGLNSDVPNTADQVAWLARAYLYLWSNGVARSYWYAYDNQAWGTLYNTTSKVLTAAGVAQQQVYSWMVGATMTSKCALSGSFWTCGLTLLNGNQAQAVWLNVFKSSATQSYTPPSQFNQYRDLKGNTTSVSGSVAIGQTPVLFENTSSTVGAPPPPTNLKNVVQ